MLLADAGMCLPELSLEGNGTVKLCYDEAALYLNAFGKQTLVELPEGTQVRSRRLSKICVVLKGILKKACTSSKTFLC